MNDPMRIYLKFDDKRLDFVAFYVPDPLESCQTSGYQKVKRITTVKSLKSTLEPVGPPPLWFGKTGRWTPSRIAYNIM